MTCPTSQNFLSMLHVVKSICTIATFSKYFVYDVSLNRMCSEIVAENFFDKIGPSVIPVNVSLSKIASLWRKNVMPLGTAMRFATKFSDRAGMPSGISMQYV